MNFFAHTNLLSGIVRLSILLLCATQSLGVLSQSETEFTFSSFRSILLMNHPVIQQSDLRVQTGESTVRAARGAFDPKLEGHLEDKMYQGTSYYDITSAQVKIPTILAAEIKAGYDLNTGQYLNPERSTPDDGLLFVGISMPLLQGLLIDERRAALNQARAFREYTVADRSLMINDLLLSGYNQYWEWWAAAEKASIMQEIVVLAVQRKEAVTSRAMAGDRPFIDTLEAHLQAQLRLQQLQDFTSREIKQRLNLSTFLWKDQGDQEVPLPLLIEPTAKPQIITDQKALSIGMDSILMSFELRLTELEKVHPIALRYRYQIESLLVEERWKREKLKPELNVNYHFLNTPADVNSSEDQTAFSTQNYRWGLDFSFPLFLREARGELQMQRIKIREVELDREQKMTDLRNKARGHRANLELLNRQYEIAQSNLSNYEALLEAERTRFLNGESSLFLINQRETAYVDARNNLVDLALKIRVAENELKWTLADI